MKLKNFILEFFSLFSKGVSSNGFEKDRMLNPIDEKEIILKWRKNIFVSIFASFLVFISVPYFMSVGFVLQHKMWVSFTVYTLSYLLIFIVVIFKQIPFRIKVIIGLFAFYSLGIVAFVYAVAGGSGKIYLLASSIVATLLLGIKFGIFTILINVIILLVVGYFVASGDIAWIEGSTVVMKVYILTGSTFIFLNSVLTISLAALVSVLEKKLVESQKTTYKLKLANDELLQNQERRKKLEELLRASEHRFSTIFKNNPAAIVLTQLSNNHLLEVNQAWVNLTEYSAAEVIGRSITDLNLWADPSQRKKIIKKITNEGVFQDEVRGFKKSGELFETLMSAEIIEIKGDSFLLTMAQDITKLKQAEESLKRSEERLRLAIKGSNDAPWDWDLINNELYYSPQWWKQIGYETDELPNDSTLWQRLMHPEDSDRVNSFFQNALEDGTESYEVEFRLKHKYGHYVPVLSRGFITRDVNTDPIRVSGTNMDLTERQRLEQALQQAQKMESIGNLAGGGLHTILTICLGSFQAMSLIC